MTPRTPLLLAWSGGKDAAWALHVLRGRDDVEVVGLLTTISGEHAVAQGIHCSVLRAQALACGLPLLEMPVPPDCDNAAYEAAFADTLAEAQARWPDVACIAYGDLLLGDVRAWREALCARLGWSARFPLFGADTAALAREMIDGGLRAWLCCVDTHQLDARFVGRAFDAALLEALPAGVDPCGENGEFHTCVADGPMFSTALSLQADASAPSAPRFACTGFQLSG